MRLCSGVVVALWMLMVWLVLVWLGLGADGFGSVGFGDGGICWGAIGVCLVLSEFAWVLSEFWAGIAYAAFV